MGKSRRDRIRGAEVVDDFAPHNFRDTRPAKLLEIKPKNDSQRHYMSLIDGKTITFGLGPAGTGKTFLAAYKAAVAFEEGDVQRIIVTRPAVEAGEELGFLPGELEEKIAPFFVPVLEALQKRLGKGRVEYMLKSKQLEFVPIAYMRGRTFDDAFIIVDEAQNTTPAQMKMILTRIGERSKYVVNGDLLQSDIPGPNGLRDARDRLRNVPGVGMWVFSDADVVRSGMAQHIVKAYENRDDSESQLPAFITG